MLKRGLFVCVLGVLLTAMPTFAATIVQTQNFSGIPNIGGSLTFNQFNNSGGTLQSINVLLYLESSNGQLILDNDGLTTASGTFEFGAAGDLADTTDVVLFSSSFSPIPGQVSAYHTGTFNLAANVGDGPLDFSPAGPDGMLYTGDLEGGVATGFVGSAFWSAGTKGFTGTGTFNIKYSIEQWINYGSIGGIEYAVNPVNTTGHVTIAYNYIPEPATIVLLTIGAFASIKRKNRK